METPTNVELLDNGDALQITGGDWVDIGAGLLYALGIAAALLL